MPIQRASAMQPAHGPIQVQGPCSDRATPTRFNGTWEGAGQGPRSQGAPSSLLHSPPSTFTVTLGLPSILLRPLEEFCRGRRLPQQKKRLNRPIALAQTACTAAFYGWRCLGPTAGQAGAWTAYTSSAGSSIANFHGRFPR